MAKKFYITTTLPYVNAELHKLATGEPLNPQFFIDHPENKFAETNFLGDSGTGHHPG